MPLRFNCEQCDVKIKVPDGSEGKKVKCPSCGHAQRVQVEAPAAAPGAGAPRVLPSRPVVATSATPPKAMDRPATEPVRPRRQEQRPAAAAPVAEEPAEVEEIIEEEDALSALASAASGESVIEREPETKPVPPAARLPRAPRETRQGRGRSQGRRGQPEVAGNGDSGAHANEHAGERSESNARPHFEPVASSPVSVTPPDTSADDVLDDEVAAAADSDTEIDTTSRVLAERTAAENAALMAFLSEPDPAPAATVVSPNAGVDAVIKSHAVAAVGPLPEESTFSAALAEVPAQSADDADQSERDATGSGAASAAASERIEQVITSTLASASIPAVAETPAADREASGGSTVATAAIGDESSSATAITDANTIAAATSPAPAGGSDGDSEAPAGEVRDLFDDFVRREEAERQAELAKEKKRRAAEAKREAKEASEAPVQPTPVVVVKTVPPPVRRGGVKTQESAGAMAEAAVGAGSSSVAMTAASAIAQSASSSPVAVAPAAAPRAPQAIPLASSTPAAAPAAISAAAAPSMKLAGGAPVADDEPQVNPIARLSSANAPASAAPAPHLDPPPAYALLLVLCWMLRMLACLSVVSVTKLLLVWSDAGASAFEVLVVLPLGLGIAAAIWGVGEVARVVRDAARR